MITANVAVVAEGIHWIGFLFRPLRAVHFFTKQVSGSLQMCVSTRVEVVQTEINLGNIKVIKSYNILYPY